MTAPCLTVWVQLDDSRQQNAALAALAVDAALEVAAPGWPGDDRTGDDGLPDALVCGRDAPERPSELRFRLRAGAGSTARPRCIVILEHADPDGVRAALTGGADAVVLQSDVDTALGAAVRAACAGLLVVPREMGRSIERPTLTVREKQILALVVLGLTNAEIATKLFVSENTVKSHLLSAFRRLGVRTRKDAVALIMDPDSGLGTGILHISDG